jgi:hypothetical protein
MGYSLDQDQWETLERNKRDGRLCGMATGKGGCFTRATWKQTDEVWTYNIGEGESHLSEITLCGRHKMEPGYEGTNFRVLSVEKLPKIPVYSGPLQ